MMKTIPFDTVHSIDRTSAIAFTDDPAFGYGLTKREYFAALIMAGFSANPNPGSNNANAKGAVDAADELIKALNKQS